MSSIVEKLGRFKRSLFNNPILIKELRLGLREKKVFIIQTVYMLILGIFSFIFLLEFAKNSTYYYRAEAGRNFFRILCSFQWVLIILISPSLTSTSITSEKEKKTYDMLLVTLLSAPEIILGKLNYAVSYIILLLASSLPLVALVFLVGGVTPLEILTNYLYLLLWGIMVSLLALFFSSREHRSSVATSQSYGTIILSGIVLMIFFASIAGFMHSSFNIKFSFKLPDILFWVTLFFDVLWAFLFLFYKTANNLRPQAKFVIGIHRLFIFGFLINMIGFLAFLSTTPSSGSGGGFLGTLSDDQISVLWLLFSMSAVFFMGCFFEKYEFKSKKEQSIINKSLSSKPFFFPAYFTLCGLIMATMFSFVYNDMFKIWASFFIFSFFLWILYLITRDIVAIFNKRFRPVFIYYPMLLAINLIPLVSWVVVQSTSKSDKALPFFSLIFIQPVFSLLSIWKTVEEFAMVSITSSIKVPTFFLTLIFYIGLYIMIKIVTTAISMFQKQKEVKDLGENK